MREVLMKGDGGFLELEVLGYENVRATDVNDANWLRAVLQVSGGPFSGSADIALTTLELNRLFTTLSAVTKTLSGEVHFESVEGNWSLRLDFERTGMAIAKGKITPDPTTENYLHYEFRVDGITLETVAKELGRVCSQFPIKG